MSVVLYLANMEVQAVTGKRGRIGKLETIASGKAPEGSIINGIVTDVDSFTRFLSEFWISNNLPKKDVYIIVNSTKIAGKAVELPKLNKKKTDEYLSRELADMQREGEKSVLGYTDLGITNGRLMQYIFATIAPKDLIGDYVDICTNIGIELRGIYSAECSIIGLIKKLETIKYKSFIAQIMNGNLVSNVLWVDGKFNYINSVRCFHDYGTEEYYEDCARSLGQIGQFMQAQKIEAPIEKIFIAGTREHNIDFYHDLAANQGVDANVEVINPEIGNNADLNFAAQLSFIAVSGLYEFGNESNFLGRYSKKDEQSNENTSAIKDKVILILAVAAIMIIVFGTSVVFKLMRQRKLNELKAYNDSSIVKSQIEEYQTASEKYDTLTSQYNSISTVKESLETYPVGSEDIIKVLNDTAKGYADIEIESFDADAGIMTVQAKAPKVKDVNRYIARLKKAKIFHTVSYTGYTKMDDGTWEIHVYCTLAESAGRKEK